MEDRLCLTMARDSLKEIYRSVEAGRHTLASILELIGASARPVSEGPVFAGILGRLVLLEKELKEEIWALEDLGAKALEDHENERFSETRIAELRQVNTRLAEIEKRMKQDFERLLPQCEKMQKEGVIDDCEIEAEVSLWLDENDPAYRRDDDNILAVCSCDVKDEACSGSGPGEGLKYNEYRFWGDHPMHREHHCFLFHELYDHKNLLEDILRADMIWLDIKVTYRNVYYLKRQ